MGFYLLLMPGFKYLIVFFFLMKKIVILYFLNIFVLVYIENAF